MTYEEKYKDLVELSHSDNKEIKRKADMPKTKLKSGHCLDGDYEIIPPDSPKNKEIEEYNRKLRPAFYAQLDKERKRKMKTLL